MNRTRGFTLIEMAIVLVLITILIGGLAMPLSAQIQARRIAETKRTLEEAREAILGYAMSHTVSARPYLPCPDSDVPPDGIENRTAGICTQNAGWFPWVTLGTAAQDAWGNRLRYASQPDLTDATSGFHNATTPPTAGWYNVCSSHDCAAIDVAADVPVVLVSHGPNGWGARNINGNTLADPSGANELENLDADGRYVSRTPAKPDDASGEFDDLTTWLSFNVILNRVCPAGGCP